MRLSSVFLAVFALSVLTVSGCGSSDPNTIDSLRSVECNQYTPKIAIVSVTPAKGPTAGGTTVTVVGGGFDICVSRLAVTFGGASASDVHVLSSTTLSCVTPPGTVGNVTVSVLAENGVANKTSQVDKKNAYEYQ